MKNFKMLCYLVFLITPITLLSQNNESLNEGVENTIEWNKFLAGNTGLKVNDDPNLLLIETVKQLIPGKAIDLGMGLGRNSIYLAMNGWDVTGVDLRDDAQVNSFVEANKDKWSIDAIISPTRSFNFGINEWDLIVHVYKGCLSDTRVASISNALKTGGIFVFEFFHHEAGIEMGWPAIGCETNAIKSAVKRSGKFTILRYTEEPGIADYGLKKYKLIKLVAVKK